MLVMLLGEGMEGVLLYLLPLVLVGWRSTPFVSVEVIVGLMLKESPGQTSWMGVCESCFSGLMV